MQKPILLMRTGFAALAIAGFCSTVVLAADANWPRWRGPRGDGHTAESGLPVRWDASSVVWKTALEGSGQSSPTIWGDRIFLTTAREDRLAKAAARQSRLEHAHPRRA